MTATTTEPTTGEKPGEKPEGFFTLEEVVEKTGIKLQRLYRLCQRGEIEGAKRQRIFTGPSLAGTERGGWNNTTVWLIPRGAKIPTRRMVWITEHVEV